MKNPFQAQIDELEREAAALETGTRKMRMTAHQRRFEITVLENILPTIMLRAQGWRATAALSTQLLSQPERILALYTIACLPEGEQSPEETTHA